MNDGIREVSLWSCWSPLGTILRALLKIRGPLPSEMTPKLDDFETQKRSNSKAENCALVRAGAHLRLPEESPKWSFF